MRITDVKSYPVWVGHRNLLIIKVETDEGVFGIGEAGLSGRELAVIGAVSHFREFLIGRDPMQIGRIWQELYRSQYYEGGRVLLAAQSAIDIALYDLVGKSLGVPIYQLLGGKHRDLVPCFPTASGGSGEEMLESVERLWSQGWRVIRTAVARAQDGPADIFEPRESLPRMAEWLVKIRETIGSELTLGIDYHHRLSVPETASFCQRMPTGTLDFLEEPIRAETPGAYEALRAMVDVPFAIGEEFASKWDFLPFIEQQDRKSTRLNSSHTDISRMPSSA